MFVVQFKDNLGLHLLHRNQLCNLYYTREQASEQKHLEIQKHKFTRRICNKELKGTLYSTNPLCVSVLSKRAIMSREPLSISATLFRTPFPAFQFHKISKFNAENYIKKASSFHWREETGNYAVVLEVRKV